MYVFEFISLFCSNGVVLVFGRGDKGVGERGRDDGEVEAGMKKEKEKKKKEKEKEKEKEKQKEKE